MGNGTDGGSRERDGTRFSLETIGNEVQHLLQASLAPGTWVVYKRGVETFMEFRKQYLMDPCWPINEYQVISFISWLSLKGMSPSSISSYISALAFVHKINGWNDPTDSFLVRKLKEGKKKKNSRVDSRLPISPAILARLVHLLPSMCNSTFEVQLFKSAFLLAFFGFLRIGEFTCTTKKGDCSRVLSINDVKVLGSSQAALEIRVRFSKTDQRGSVVKLQIDSASDKKLCPVAAISDYLQMRPIHQGPLFIHFNKEPLLSRQFSHILKKGVQLMGLTPSHYSAHSFRIGAATAAAIGGLSEDKIKEMGRWKSSAYQLYIRPQKLQEIV